MRSRHVLPSRRWLPAGLACALALRLHAMAVPLPTPPATTARVDRAPAPRRGGPVSLSLQNEIDAAVDRGRAWLLANQNADGSWGVTNRLGITALAAIALWQDATPVQHAAAARAARWLASAAADAPRSPWPGFEQLAWREVALDVAGMGAPARKEAFAEQVRRRSATVGNTPFAAMMVREALWPAPVFVPLPPAASNAAPATLLLANCALAMPPPDAPPGCTAILARVAVAWPTAGGGPLAPGVGVSRQRWILARFLNRAGGGVLADAQGRLIDWRNDLARALVASQTIDARQPGGFWAGTPGAADWAADPLAETAFALLALQEL